jgi:hypothetical protein
MLQLYNIALAHFPAVSEHGESVIFKIYNHEFLFFFCKGREYISVGSMPYYQENGVVESL